MSNITVIQTLLCNITNNIMDRDSSDGSELNRLMISYNATEIINAPIDIITVPSSEDDREDSGEDVPALSAVEVSESSRDEGGDDLEKGEPEKEEPRKRAPRVDLQRKFLTSRMRRRRRRSLLRFGVN